MALLPHIIRFFLVFYQFGYFKGSVTKNVALPPSVSSQPTLPFIIFASSSAMLSPNPKFDLSVLDLSAQ